MQTIRIVGNYIAEFDSPTNPNRGQGQLQLVLHDQNSLSREIELARPAPDSGFGPAQPSPWQFNEQLHGGPTPYIGWNDAVQNPNRYKQVELDLRSGTTAEGTWQLIEQITASLANQGFAIRYDARNQNENSFVTSVLSVIGIDITDLPRNSYTPIDVSGYNGIGTNIFEAGAQGFILGEAVRINLNLAGTNQTDYIQGGTGDDILKGASYGFDTINGGAGDDSITGSYQDNWLQGEEGDDRIDGSWGNDSIWGGEGRDVLFGGAGNDVVVGGAGNDVIVGGNGNDRVYGSSGADDLYGSGGNDYLVGGSGDDDIIGGDGSDIAYGGAGNDVFYDGRGNDTYFGNAGRDTFVFYAQNLTRGSRDQVRDFESGTDKLFFSNITSYLGHTISSGSDADTNGDGKISALDKGWFNSSSNALVFYDEDFATIRINMTDGVQELQLFDFL